METHRSISVSVSRHPQFTPWPTGRLLSISGSTVRSLCHTTACTLACLAGCVCRQAALYVGRALQLHFLATMSGPTLSPVSLLCATCAASQRGKVPDFQHRQKTPFSPSTSLILHIVATFGLSRSTMLLIRNGGEVTSIRTSA